MRPHQWSYALQILYKNKTCCLLSASDLKYVPKVGVASLIVYKIRHPSTSTKSTNSVTSHSVSIEPQQVLAHGRQQPHKCTALSLEVQSIVICPVCLCVCGCVCVWVCYHYNSKLLASIFTKTGFVGNGSDHLQLIKFWPSYSTPGRGSAVGRKLLAPPYYSQHTVFASLGAFCMFLCYIHKKTTQLML